MTGVSGVKIKYPMKNKTDEQTNQDARNSKNDIPKKRREMCG